MAMKRKKTPATELAGNADPCAPLDGASLLSAAKPLLKELAADLLARADGSSAVTEALQARHLAEQKAQRTADAYPQFGLGAEVTPTLHWSSLADEPWALYQAPELRENPLARGVVSDVFSLGALAYLVLTGHPPADSVLALDERLGREHELDPRASADGIPEKVARVVELATASNPSIAPTTSTSGSSCCSRAQQPPMLPKRYRSPTRSRRALASASIKISK